MGTYAEALILPWYKAESRGEAAPNTSVDAEFSNYVKCKMLIKQLEALSECLEGENLAM